MDRRHCASGGVLRGGDGCHGAGAECGARHAVGGAENDLRVSINCRQGDTSDQLRGARCQIFSSATVPRVWSTVSELTTSRHATERTRQTERLTWWLPEAVLISRYRAQEDARKQRAVFDLPPRKAE